LIKSSFARVFGRVQGVGFRYHALNKARALGLKGWVKNESDGTVTARFEGSEEIVNQYISWLKAGPPSSVVKNVIVEDLNPDDSLETFHVKF